MLFLISSLLNLVSKLPFHPVVFRSFLICVFPLTPQSYCMGRLECLTHERNGETSSQGRYMHDVHVMNNREMNYQLKHFMHEVRRQDGKSYPPSTMQQIVAGLQYSGRKCHSECLTTVNFRRRTLSLVCSGLHLYCLFWLTFVCSNLIVITNTFYVYTLVYILINL